MQELIKITDREGQQVVSARELHEFLGSKQDFSTWIKARIKKYNLEDGVDFAPLHKIVERVNGPVTAIEYALTLDTAKELAMVEGNAKGKEARQYFIACEKKLREQQPTALAIPQDFASALRLAADNHERAEQEKTQRLLVEAHNEELSLVNQEQQQQLSIAAPKVSLYDQCMSSPNALAMDLVANALDYEYQGKPLGRTNLYKFLYAHGILKASKVPHSNYTKYFDMQIGYHDENGVNAIHYTPRVKPIGLAMIKVKLDQAGAIPRPDKLPKHGKNRAAYDQLSNSADLNHLFD